MPTPLTWGHLKVHEPDIEEAVADSMIAITWARATKIAPCLKEMTWTDDVEAVGYEDTQLVIGILQGVVLRWSEAGNGGVTQQAAGDYQQTNSGYAGGLFRPDEIRDLQQLCEDTRSTYRASTIPTGADPVYVQHAEWCAVRFGTSPVTLCDCGAEISGTGLPLWTRP